MEALAIFNAGFHRLPETDFVTISIHVLFQPNVYTRADFGANSMRWHSKRLMRIVVSSQKETGSGASALLYGEAVDRDGE